MKVLLFQHFEQAFITFSRDTCAKWGSETVGKDHQFVLLQRYMLRRDKCWIS